MFFFFISGKIMVKKYTSQTILVTGKISLCKVKKMLIIF